MNLTNHSTRPIAVNNTTHKIIKKALLILLFCLGLHSTTYAGYFIKQPIGGQYGTSLDVVISHSASYTLDWYKDDVLLENKTTLIYTGNYGIGEYYAILTDDSGSIKSNVVTITPRTLMVWGITINNKVYDGTTTATIDNWSTLQNKLGSDDVSIDVTTSTANFDTKDVATDKTVTTNLVLTGSKAANYTLTQPTGFTANISAKEISDVSITIDNIPSQSYTGNAVEPKPVVKDGATILVENTDYTLSYLNNIDSGTATITITGIGNYTNSKDVTFNIEKADPVITWPVSAAITYGESLSQAVLSGGSGDGIFTFRNGTSKPSVSDSDATDYVLVFTPIDTDNYNVLEKTDMKVTVNKALLTVTARTLSITYGTNPLSYQAGDAYDISGFVGSENEAVLTTRPVVSINPSITSSTAPGSYPNAVNVSGALASNYSFIYVPANLTLQSTNTDIATIHIDEKEAIRRDNDFYIIAGCGNHSATVLVTADAFATVSINGVEQNPATVSLPVYGDNIIFIEIKAQNGNTTNYTLTINKPAPFDQMVKTRWNNTFTVINNPDNNGGYSFTSYKWYRNGQEISTEQSWSAGANGELLNTTDRYYVELTAHNFAGVLRTCESTVALRNMSVRAYPNPVSSSQTLYVEADVNDELLQDAVIEVYNAAGNCVGLLKVQGQLTPVDVNYTSGIHFFILKGKDGFTKELKIVVR